MNQDSSLPPMLPPSTELGALLFALIPCLQETYRPLASFAYHMSELTKLKSLPSMPPLSSLTDVNALISDKDILLRSLSFYGRVFRMPLLSTIANLLQALNLYNTYKDILPGLFGSAGDGTSDSPLGNMGGLLSGLGGLGGFSPDLLSSLFSGGTTGSTTTHTASESNVEPTPTEAFSDQDTELTPSKDISNQETEPASSPDSSSEALFQESTPTDMEQFFTPEFPEQISSNSSTQTTEDDASNQAPSFESAPSQATDSSDDLFNTLSSFLTPEQKKIYEQLMHTD